MQKAKKVSVTSMCLGVFHIIIQLCLVIYMEDKAAALLATMVFQAVTTFVIFIIYSYPHITFKFNFKETGKYIKYSLSQFPSDLSVWMVQFTDRIFINKYISHSSAGIYGLGANIGSIPAMVFLSVNSAFTPFVNSQYKAIETANDEAKEEELKKNLARAFMVVSSIFLCLVTGLVVFSRDIVSLLNKAYADAFFVVVVMLITSLMNSYRIIYMAPLAYNIKYTKIKSLIWLIAGVLNIVLNFLLIPTYGIYAACINSLVTYIITFLLMLYYSKKAFYIKYEWGELLKIALVSIVYTVTLFMSSSLLNFAIKIILMIPYLYLCLNLILKINLFRMGKDFVSNYIKNHHK